MKSKGKDLSKYVEVFIQYNSSWVFLGISQYMIHKWQSYSFNNRLVIIKWSIMW